MKINHDGNSLKPWYGYNMVGNKGWIIICIRVNDVGTPSFYCSNNNKQGSKESSYINSKQ